MTVRDLAFLTAYNTNRSVSVRKTTFINYSSTHNYMQHSLTLTNSGCKYMKILDYKKIEKRLFKRINY